MNEIPNIANLIKVAKKITFLTGAGMSTESGISDWRSTNGIWTNNQGLEDIISREYFEDEPESFWKYYKEIFKTKLLNNYLPNSGHHFITELQNAGKDVAVITQNIDGLHSIAETKSVFEVHGTLQTATCPKCQEKYDLNYINNNKLPLCKHKDVNGNVCNTVLKPDVVLFGDEVKLFNNALDVAYEADLFITLGSSLEVSPINSIPRYIARTDIPTVLINKTATQMDYLFDYCIYSTIGETVNQLKEYL